jgi:hypothetical protein
MDPKTLRNKSSKEEAFKALSDYMDCQRIEKKNTTTPIKIFP